MFEALNIPGQIHYIDMPKDLEGKYQNYTCADMSKTKAVLGDIANCAPLKDSIIDYVRNHILSEKTW